jgi:mRNA interferase YafQ
MSSKRAEKNTAGSERDRERTPVPQASGHTKQFLAEWDTRSKSGRFDLKRLKDVMMAPIANDGSLPLARKDRALHGKEWRDCRECHIGGNFLLVYKLGPNSDIVFVRSSNHSELFGE